MCNCVINQTLKELCNLQPVENGDEGKEESTAPSSDIPEPLPADNSAVSEGAVSDDKSVAATTTNGTVSPAPNDANTVNKADETIPSAPTASAVAMPATDLTSLAENSAAYQTEQAISTTPSETPTVATANQPSTTTTQIEEATPPALTEAPSVVPAPQSEDIRQARNESASSNDVTSVAPDTSVASVSKEKDDPSTAEEKKEISEMKPSESTEAQTEEQKPEIPVAVEQTPASGEKPAAAPQSEDKPAGPDATQAPAVESLPEAQAPVLDDKLETLPTETSTETKPETQPERLVTDAPSPVPASEKPSTQDHTNAEQAKAVEPTAAVSKETSASITTVAIPQSKEVALPQSKEVAIPQSSEAPTPKPKECEAPEPQKQQKPADCLPQPTSEPAAKVEPQTSL